MLSGGSSDNALYEFDLSDGTVTQVGDATNYGNSIVTDITPSGVAVIDEGPTKEVYVVDSVSNALYTLNESDGTLTRVDSDTSQFGASITTPSGLASVRGVLYMGSTGTGGGLHVLNVEDGSVEYSLVDEFGLSLTSVTALTTINEALYAVDSSTDLLYQVDPITGVANAVDSSVSQFDDSLGNPVGISSFGGTNYQVWESDRVVVPPITEGKLVVDVNLLLQNGNYLFVDVDGFDVTLTSSEVIQALSNSKDDITLPSYQDDQDNATGDFYSFTAGRGDSDNEGGRNIDFIRTQLPNGYYSYRALETPDYILEGPTWENDTNKFHLIIDPELAPGEITNLIFDEDSYSLSRAKAPNDNGQLYVFGGSDDRGIYRLESRSGHVEDSIGSVDSTVIDYIVAAAYDSGIDTMFIICLLYTSPSPRDRTRSRMPSSA